MSNIPNLASLARLRLWSWGWSTVRRKAFWFDWTNDYISSNATIGRTGYDMNVSGNVTTGSDGDGSYIWINWNRDATAVTWSLANILSWVTSFNQSTDFTVWFKIKINANPAVWRYSWIFWESTSSGFYINVFSTGNKIRVVTKPTYSAEITTPYTVGTTLTFHAVYQASSGKVFCYKDGVLQNSWWTAMSPTFSLSKWYIWDSWSETTVNDSASKNIYRNAVRNKALTQAEIDADIALWNTTKQDPSIVAYYVPENLQFNTDYITTKDFSNVARTKTGTTVTSGIADIRWWADAYTLTMSAGAGNGATITNNTISGATIASKTFIMKVFAWTASWTATMRLRISHNGVSTYYSADQTVTTTPQEFTFTQALTSSTSGTWMTYWIEVWSAAWAATINVFYPTDWLTNQTLRDESPNIWWFIGRKTPLVMSARVKPDIDSADTITKQCFFQLPRHYMQLRTTNNFFQFRSETSLQARSIATGWNTALWTWFRGKVNLMWVKYRDWTWRVYKGYVNWVETNTWQSAYSTTIRPAWTIYRTNASVWFYTTDYRDGNIRDIRAYTFIWSFTNADALAIYNWWEPTSAWVTKYLHYKPPVGEVGTTTQDLSPNDRDWTLNGGVTRIYL